MGYWFGFLFGGIHVVVGDGCVMGGASKLV